MSYISRKNGHLPGLYTSLHCLHHESATGFHRTRNPASHIMQKIQVWTHEYSATRPPGHTLLIQIIDLNIICYRTSKFITMRHNI